MKMKKVAKVLASVVVGTMMVASTVLPAVAAESTDICKLPLAPSNSETLSAAEAGICNLPLAPSRNSALDALVAPNIENPSARAGYIQVKVSSPCDAQWRSDYPDTWMAEANTAVELADDQLSDWFGIDFQSVAQNTWTSPNGSLEDILNSARDNVGLKNGAQIMIAFSGRSPGAGGAAYKNTRYCVVFDQGTTNNGYVIRHEVGHLYGCPDEYNTATGQFTSKKCLMNDCYTYNDTICSSCYSIWDGNKNSK